MEIIWVFQVTPCFVQHLPKKGGNFFSLDTIFLLRQNLKWQKNSFFDCEIFLTLDMETLLPLKLPLELFMFSCCIQMAKQFQIWKCLFFAISSFPVIEEMASGLFHFHLRFTLRQQKPSVCIAFFYHQKGFFRGTLKKVYLPLQVSILEKIQGTKCIAGTIC